MTLQEIFKRYTGWCPHFKMRINSLPTYTNLSISGRVVFIALLLLTGFMSIMQALIFVSGWIRDNFNLGYLGYQFMHPLLTFSSGILLIVLTIDFIATGTVLRRHKLELLGYVAILVMETTYWLSFNVLAFLSGSPATFNGIQEFRELGFIILGIYIGYKLLTDKKILVKNTFLLLSIFFIGWLLNQIDNTLLSWNSTNSSLPLDAFRVDMILIDVIFGVAALFFFKTYLKLRRQPLFELTSPIYVRGVILLYGASMLVQSIYGVFLSRSATNLDNYGGMAGFTAMAALSVVLPLTFVFASFYSLRFSVGENSHTVLEVGT